jgi:hypothetical protein
LELAFKKWSRVAKCLTLIKRSSGQCFNSSSELTIKEFLLMGLYSFLPTFAEYDQRGRNRRIMDVHGELLIHAATSN